jgi:prepilin-type N-terminal cleavage/methylation domain-containing protein/prepilin-type processing-associated H-X9-DG protein
MSARVQAAIRTRRSVSFRRVDSQEQGTGGAMRRFSRLGVPRATLRAFTLVELLVVIAIIGVLVALLLPAIQAAREAARRSQCANNLKQLGLAVQLHHTAKKTFPTGRNKTDEQSVSWAYYCLPYIEQQAMYQAYRPSLAVYHKDNAAVFRSPVATFFCPSRRAPVADRDFDTNDGAATPPPDADAAGKAAGGDYAANSGEEPGYENANGDDYDPTETGPIFTRSRINEKHVTDGLSNTFVIGEKFITDQLEEGATAPAPGTEHAFFGDSAILAGDSKQTIMRSTEDGFPEGSPDDDDNKRFGSEHNQQCHFVFLDGSVRLLSYSIDRGVYEALSCISDDIVTSGNY